MIFQNLFRYLMMYSLSVLMAVQPTLVYASPQNTQKLKKFFEISKIGSEEVRVLDLYARLAPHMSPVVKEQMQELVLRNPNARLPRFNVSKVKGPGGKDYVNLSFVESGKAYSMTIIGEGGVFARVNGKNLYFKDVAGFNPMTQKLEEILPFKYQDQPVVTPKQVRFLKVSEIQKLKPAERKKYYKLFTESLVLIEKFQSTDESTKATKKTSWLEVLLQEANASDRGKQCLVAGNITTVQLKGTKETCGSINDTGLRGSCSAGQAQCNPALFAGNPLCVTINTTSTAECIRRSSANDFPKIILDAESSVPTRRMQLDRVIETANQNAQEILQLCSNPNYVMNEIKEDQRATCGQVQARLETINSWVCDKSGGPNSSWQDYSAFCSVGGGDEEQEEQDQEQDDQNQSSTTTTTLVSGSSSSTTAGGPPIEDSEKCENKYGFPQNLIVGGPKGCINGHADELQFDCYHGSQKTKAYICSCNDNSSPNGNINSRSCPKNDLADSRDSRGKKNKTLGIKNSTWKWVGIFALGIGALMLMDYGFRKQADAYYRVITPTPTNPPVPPPDTPPPPRGVN